MRIFSALFFLCACATSKPAHKPVHLYMHSVENHGFVRLQNAEVVPYENAPQWICETPDDFEILIESLKSN